MAEEGEDVVVGGVAGDPGEAGGVGVALPEGGFVAVDGVEVADEVADAAVVGFGGVGGVQEPPVGAVGFGPFGALGEFLAHEEELFAGVGPHEAEVGAGGGALLPPVAGHLRHE